MNDVYTKLYKLDFLQLPKQVQELHCVQPKFSAEVNYQNKVLKLDNPNNLQFHSPSSVMPKLGIKSWRNNGSLGVIYEGSDPVLISTELLKRPTKAQNIVVKAWQTLNKPLNIYYFPYIDLSSAIEMRFIGQSGQLKQLSACWRGQHTVSYPELQISMKALASRVSSLMPDYAHIIDIVRLPTGEIHLMEINPALSLPELKLLSS